MSRVPPKSCSQRDVHVCVCALHIASEREGQKPADRMQPRLRPLFLAFFFLLSFALYIYRDEKLLLLLLLLLFEKFPSITQRHSSDVSRDVRRLLCPIILQRSRARQRERAYVLLFVLSTHARNLLAWRLPRPGRIGKTRSDFWEQCWCRTSACTWHFIFSLLVRVYEGWMLWERLELVLGKSLVWNEKFLVQLNFWNGIRMTK